MDIRVLVLAAGRGSRLAQATGDLPKPLVQVGGRALVEWSLAWAASAGAREIWLNLHHRGGQIREALGESYGGARLRYSEEEELLGTAGGWRRAVECSGGSDSAWLVLYGDNLMRFDLQALLARHAAAGEASNGPLATVALFDPGRHRNTGIAGGGAVLGPDGMIAEFMEGELTDRHALVNAGAYVLEPEVVRWIGADPADFGRDVLPRLAEAGLLRGHVLEAGGFCLGVDTPERLRVAETMLARAEVTL